MASYAALLSLTHTLNQIKNHPRPPISIHQQQLHSLTQNLTFLINFLERYSGREDEDLESRIADAAYAAEDVIEAHIVDQAGSTSDHGKNISPVDLYGGLEKVIQELDLIKREVVEIMIKEENTGAQLYDDQLGKKSSVSASSRQSSTMVVFDDVLINKVLDELSGQQSNLQIISIDGMGGIEDYVICVSSLVKFWVAEGILRPIGGKRLEEVAEKYVNELIDRNLILIDKLRWNGKAKLCKMHDLLRDLGIREAKKQRFLCVLKHQQSLNIPQCMNMERRICIHQNIEEEYSPQFFHALEFASLTRSLIPTSGLPESVQSLSFRLLRVYSEDIYSNGLASAKAVFQRVNMRLLNIALRLPQLSRFPSSWFLFWNLQTLKVDIKYSLKPVIAPSEIWEMPLLRHVMIKDLQLPDLLCGENDLILEDLQTLSRISNFKCNEVVIKRIPNIKTLKLKYHISFGETEYLDFGHLKELESLNIFMDRTAILDGKTFQRYLEQNLSLPHSLKKLTLRGTMLNWEECTTKIGSLPLLECLRLDWEACCGAEWETVEGQFCSLKVLRIDSCNLRYWITDSTHFPRLEDLLLRLLVDLEEIPLSIGDIPTLKSIRLDGCSTSAADSARRIIEEQRELENMDLQLHIIANGAQVLTPDDGFSFIKEVKDTFQYQTEKYDRFLEVMTDSNDERYVKEVHLIIKNGLCS
ncbi:hypothetical protein ACS0TY_000167 [Phlomoides rotata]